MGVAQTLSSRLKRMREERGYTIAALADACGISEGAIRQIETGNVKSPSLHVGLRIAKVLDVDPFWLATGDDGVSTQIAKLESRLAKVERRIGGS
jgi:transcriptional regulator with XRE-family HTH domain